MKPLLRMIDTARADLPLPPHAEAARQSPASPEARLCIGALTLLLRHGLTGCSRAAEQAADLLERIAAAPGVDRDMRRLCEAASQRLDTRPLAVLR
ncbi:MAG TPA: hypothetical protein PLX20_09130 [Rhodocyclaceae bacterium]|nr:hypothetical protein [Rhodocyclaceae bacterium]HMV54348.1 hypothetical protein [Rhodocyclaceae bacterium]HMZ84025.1 hypothetical protein [Rhodocyclaceae bacterium]HNA03641.1 hypothetical protein [Rhodocyclaceae bacterium]HNB80045.1 hypothetical protein [Rhodocyclaceae bacterium]